jgi:hypothetical protein
MKMKIIALSLMMAAGSVFAADVAAPPTNAERAVCVGDAAAKFKVYDGSGTPVAAPIFVKTGFDVQCSSNTYVSFAENSGTQFTVASGSKKGNQSFKGSSNGGAVTVHLKCTGANDACGSGDVTTALTAAAASI